MAVADMHMYVLLSILKLHQLKVKNHKNADP